MIRFTNFEFTFAIKNPKFTRRSVVGRLIKHKIRGPFFISTLGTWKDFGGTCEGAVHPSPCDIDDHDRAPRRNLASLRFYCMKHSGCN